MKKILIWGTGYWGNLFFDEFDNKEIIGFIETVKSKEEFRNKPVYGISEIPTEYDYILIANTYGTEIYKECLNRKICLEKVIFVFAFPMQVGCCNLKVLKEVLSEKIYTIYCAENRLTEGTWFEEDKKRYSELNKREDFRINEHKIVPWLKDKYYEAGSVHTYFHMDLWAAKLIHKSGVKKHIDIGSRVDGFIAHLLAMGIEVSLLDIREFPYDIENLNAIICDATRLEEIEDESIESLSALSSLEHFGLGRYGDPIDPEACFSCFDAIQRKLKEGAHFYLSVPIGKDEVHFNSARVFSPATIVNCFKELTLQEFSYTAGPILYQDMVVEEYDLNYHHPNGCDGLYHFIKK